MSDPKQGDVGESSEAVGTIKRWRVERILLIVLLGESLPLYAYFSSGRFIPPYVVLGPLLVVIVYFSAGIAGVGGKGTFSEQVPRGSPIRVFSGKVFLSECVRFVGVAIIGLVVAKLLGMAISLLTP